MTDTIHALATAPGRAAIAVLRLSGPRAGDVAKSLAGSLPAARRASLRTLRDGEGVALDRGLVIWTPGPGSFTGEDAAEFHVHGGRAVMEAVAAALAAAGSRPAEPGEFTRRAFENGKLDLTEAEGVADLVDAETQAQRRQALAQLEGGVARAVAAWRSRLLRALAHLEAAVDFPDEDLPEDVAARARPDLLALRDDLALAAADRRGERLREGLRIALVGAPNAGKSSLLNALAGRDAAIVSATPGTTRDVVEVHIELAGVPTVLADTAGLRDTQDAVEAEGVRRAAAWAQDADLRLWVVDAAATTYPPPSWLREKDVIVASKSDLAAKEAIGPDGSTWNIVRTSTVTRGGMDGLRAILQRWAADIMSGAEAPVVTRERHRARLLAAVAHLDRAVYAQSPSVELLAEDARLAARELERLTGRIDAESVLGEIFGAFCIGK